METTRYRGDGLPPHEEMSRRFPYLADARLVKVVNMAIVLRRPLLIKGPPGCGKTCLAPAIAHELGLPLHEWYVKSTSRARDGLYVVDVLRRLQDAQMGDPKAQKLRPYLRFGPLGEALRHSGESVVLIDEIDKADIDFPNDLLYELEKKEFACDGPRAQVPSLLMSDVTQILCAIEQGDPKAAKQLLPLVYGELRKLAAQKLAQEKPGQTLQATALVHEAYVRLVGGVELRWDSSGHFFAAAAEAMRRILIDQARRKRSTKHGGQRQRIEIDGDALQAAPDKPHDDLLALDEALNQLEREDPVKARLVQLRYFAGLSVEEAAQALSISPATAKRYWVYARSWLYGKLNGE